MYIISVRESILINIKYSVLKKELNLLFHILYCIYFISNDKHLIILFRVVVFAEEKTLDNFDIYFSLYIT